MTKEKIIEILKEFNFEDDQITLLLNSKFLEDRDEQRAREIIQLIAEDKNRSNGQKITKETFSSILKEYDYPDFLIEILWNKRISDYIDEQKMRETALQFSPEDYAGEE
ncbi:MAG: hypothetical protein HYW78_00100 [Parcubacteria group bacterium]|nr:hypothetical protein [Parcubacteria group bacterium]